MIRRAQAGDREGIIALWGAVFGDEPGYVARCLDVFAGEGNVFVQVNDAHGGAGGVDAVLSMVPCVAGESGEHDGRKSCKGFYLFALATRPEQRGRGLMAELLAHAEAEAKQRGAAFLALIPASAGLFGYYHRFGFVDLPLRAAVVELANAEHAADAAGGNGAPVATKTAASTTQSCKVSKVNILAVRLPALRRAYLETGPDDGPKTACISFSPRRFAMVAQAAADEGWRLFVNNAGYAVAKAVGGVLAVAELGAQSDEDARGLLHTAAAALAPTSAALQNAIITLPQKSGIFSAEKSRMYAAAQMRPLRAGIRSDEMYLRFGIDEVFEKNYENPGLFASL